nr:MAG TPA: hypothetical protein [Caudoviricetes sp.]
MYININSFIYISITNVLYASYFFALDKVRILFNYTLFRTIVHLLNTHTL